VETVIVGVVGAVLGAALGALFTVGGTWWLTVHLDRQRARRQLHAAIGVVAAELEENRDRIERYGGLGDALRTRLTLGDWLASKNAFAGLALRGEDQRMLWETVARTYGAISDFRAGFRDDTPGVDELSDLVSRLIDERSKLDQEIGAFVHASRA
jgi:hypothetical protein